MDELNQSCGEDKANRAPKCDQEADEVDVVLHTNAIIDPRTVVVKSLNTHVACTAMPTSWRANDQTIWTNFDQ